jgi:hypothetical protein
MTISISPSTLPTVKRYETFSSTITASANASEVITSVTCVKNFTDSNVVIANGTTSVTISGKHTTAFQNDEAKYVEKGSSDLLQTPTVVYSFSDVPPNKDLYEANQDPGPAVTRTYDVTVNYFIGSETFVVSQVVENDETVAYNFLRNYF